MPVISTITFDCADAMRLAEFWALALNWSVAPSSTPELAIVGGPNRPADAPTLLFMAVPEAKTAKNRNHMDLHTTRLDEEMQRLIDAGATLIHEKHEHGFRWFTLADPEGNEFCLVHDAEAGD